VEELLSESRAQTLPRRFGRLILHTRARLSVHDAFFFFLDMGPGVKIQWSTGLAPLVPSAVPRRRQKEI